MNAKDFERELISRKPIRCDECGGRLFYQAAGEYLCEQCGKIILDAYGVVRRYIEENGPAQALVISAETGVDPELIGAMLYDGKVMIPEGSQYYVKCERCGGSLRFGRLCPGCAKLMSDHLANAFVSEKVGVRPRWDPSEPKEEMKGRMHYLGRDRR